MKITDVQAMVLVDEHRRKDWILVRVYTDSGLVGVGESGITGGGVKQAVLEMKRLVIGEDPLNVDMLVQKMIRRTVAGGAKMQAASGIEIASLADSYYIPLAPHNVGGPVGTVAAVHLCAAIPNFHTLEFHAPQVPWFEELVSWTRPMFDGGYIAVPTVPGLGIELNMREAARHLKEGERLFD